MLSLQFIALLGVAIGAAYRQISRGKTIEHAAVVTTTRHCDQRTDRAGDTSLRSLTDDDRHAVPLFRLALPQFGGGTFIGIVVLAGMIDYFELMRRGADWPKATAWVLAKISIFRVPQLTEHIMPFAVLVGAMSCYLTLSRRLELVIARAAGISAWQFVAPALMVAFLFGTIATTAYNPIAAILHERSKRLKSKCSASRPRRCRRAPAASGSVRRAPTVRPSSTPDQPRTGLEPRRRHHLHLRQRRTVPGADRGAQRRARNGYWQLDDTRIYSRGKPPQADDHLSPQYQPDAGAGA